jgi:hypothetical protein
MFGWYHHSSSGAQTTVSTASGICHSVIATCRYRGRVGTGLSVLWLAYAYQWPNGLRLSLRPLVWWYCGFESRRLFLVRVLHVVKYRSLRWADHSTKGVLSTVLRRCAWSRNLKNEEEMARVRPQRHRKQNVFGMFLTVHSSYFPIQ